MTVYDAGVGAGAAACAWTRKVFASVTIWLLLLNWYGK